MENVAKVWYNFNTIPNPKIIVYIKNKYLYLGACFFVQKLVFMDKVFITYSIEFKKSDSILDL